MNKLIFTISSVLIVFWVVGYFLYDVGPMIHILLVTAVIAVMIRINQVNNIHHSTFQTKSKTKKTK